MTMIHLDFLLCQTTKNLNFYDASFTPAENGYNISPDKGYNVKCEIYGSCS